MVKKQSYVSALALLLLFIFVKLWAFNGEIDLAVHGGVQLERGRGNGRPQRALRTLVLVRIFESLLHKHFLFILIEDI